MLLTILPCFQLSPLLLILTLTSCNQIPYERDTPYGQENLI